MTKIQKMHLCYIVTFSTMLSACGSTSLLQSEKPEQGVWFCQPSSKEDWNCADNVPADKKRLINSVKPPFAAKESSKNNSEKTPQAVKSAVEADTAQEPATIKEPPKSDAEKRVISNTAELETTQSIELRAQQMVAPATDKSNRSKVDGRYVLQFGAFKKPTNPAYIGGLSGSKWLLTQVKGQQWFVLVVDGFANRASAQNKADELEVALAIPKPWIRSSASLRKVLVD